MRTAKEIFEKLGYVKIETIDENECILYQSTEDSIFIFPRKKEFTKRKNGMFISPTITYNEFLAINKQCEELGWFDE